MNPPIPTGENRPGDSEEEAIRQGDWEEEAIRQGDWEIAEAWFNQADEYWKQAIVLTQLY
jgi:hypothetical protein